MMNFNKKNAGKGNGSDSNKSTSATYARPPAPTPTTLKPPAQPPASTTFPGSPVRSSSIETKPQQNQKEVTTQAIAEAAYFLWKKRGGSELVNWLEAEASLRSASKR